MRAQTTGVGGMGRGDVDLGRNWQKEGGQKQEEEFEILGAGGMD